MPKVLSTKLTVDEANRFNAAAERRGLSKAALLKHLVKEYLGHSNKESKTSNNPSFEKRQTPEKCNRESLQLDKQEVLRNGELEKCFSQMHQPGRIQNCIWRVSADSRLVHISNTEIDLRTIAELAKVPDSSEAITKKLSVEQGLSTARPKLRLSQKQDSGSFYSLV